MPTWKGAPVFDYVDTTTLYLDSGKIDKIWRKKKDIFSENAEG
jgi:hypothetical protein